MISLAHQVTIRTIGSIKDVSQIYKYKHVSKINPPKEIKLRGMALITIERNGGGLMGVEEA